MVEPTLSDAHPSPNPEPRLWRRKPWTFLRLIKYGIGVCLLLVAGIVALNFRPLPGPNQPALRVSRETTWITEPLKANGDVDSVAWLNRHLSEKLRPEDNAAAALAQAIGPNAADLEQQGEFFSKLATSPPAAGEKCHIALGEWLEDRVDEITSGLEPLVAQLEPDDRPSVYGEVPFDSQSNPLVAEWLEEMAPVLEQVRAASRKSRWYVPRLGDQLAGKPVPLVSEVRVVARTLAISAMRHLGHGDIEAAMHDSLAVLRLARLMGDSGSLLELIVATSLDGIGQNMVRQIVVSGRCSSAQLETIERSLAAIGPPPGIHARNLPADRLETIEEAVNMARGAQTIDFSPLRMLNPASRNRQPSKLHAASIGWNVVGLELNKGYDRIGELLDEAELEPVLAACNTLTAEFDEPKGDGQSTRYALSGKNFRARSVARRMLKNCMTVIEALLEAKFRQRAQLDSLRAAIAIKRFRLVHQRLPVELEELVPDFLKEVPKDIWSGESLRYRHEDDSWQVYSIGPDRKDGGGFELGEHLDAWDLTGSAAIRTVDEAVKQYLPTQSNQAAAER